MMANNNKVKGLLKGLRYISQIFDEEKEPEMQIGFPTDVKHVAHIGYDGPKAASPSWMTDFQSQPGGVSSGSLDNIAEPKESISEDSSSRGGSRSRGTDRTLPDLPKSTRRHSSESVAGDSPPKEKSKHSRRSSKGGTTKDSSNLTDNIIRKKNRRKKSKDGLNSKIFQAKDADYGSESGSVSKSVNGEIFNTLEDDDARNGFSAFS